MAAPPPDARPHRARVLSVRETGEDAVVLRLALPEPLRDLRAGRFFMLRRPDVPRPAIPRPFSVYREHADGSLDFLIKVVGPGTCALAAVGEGSEVLAIGPLGNGWTPFDGAGAPWVFVAGGIGSAPFYQGIRQALAGGDGRAAVEPDAITMIYGAAKASMLYDFDEFAALGVRTLAATDDGSRGFAGNVVELLRAQWASGELPARVRLATCGPEPMMQAVVREAEARGLECHLSLETLMGCGVGICNGCAVPTRPDGPQGDWPVLKCCVDGPVFAASTIRI